MIEPLSSVLFFLIYSSRPFTFEYLPSSKVSVNTF
nr:MAG TPA: hypothetical protein [Bacteriophage sp.]DAQ68252.1 MAG TPA: hypothetical protein [Bacteriophage sp.]